MNHSLSLEGAESVSTKPLSGFVVRGVHGVQLGEVSQEVSDEQKKSSNQAQSLDDSVAILVLARLRQGSVDD